MGEAGCHVIRVPNPYTLILVRQFGRIGVFSVTAEKQAIRNSGYSAVGFGHGGFTGLPIEIVRTIF